MEIGLSDDQLAKLTMREKLDALDEANWIHWPPGGGFPRFKKYLHYVKGRAIGDLWTDINVINSQAAERTGFPTQKPEALIKRILEMGSNEGDIVLDCFLGSGTTAGVAHKMGRRWVGVEWSREIVETYILPRLTEVVDGKDFGGISESVAWQGGGGFRVLDIAPSMFRVADGRVVLADWATGGALAEAVAAQARFIYQPDDAPLCGRRGRQRLAVVDGLVNEGVLRILLDWLDERELLTVYGTAVDPACLQAISRMRRGSVVKKIPQSVLDDYRRRSARRDGLDWSQLKLDQEPQVTSKSAGR